MVSLKPVLGGSKMLHHLKRNHHLRRTFYAYLIAFTGLSLGIIILISMISYSITASAISEEIVTRQSMNLGNKVSNLTATTSDIIEAAYTIGLDNSVLLYVKNPDNHYLQNDVVSLLEQVDLSEDDVIAVELYVAATGELLSSEGAGQLINDQLSESWLTLAVSEDVSQKWEGPFTYYDHDYEEIPVLTYIQRLPVGSNQTVGYIAIHTKELDIFNWIQPETIYTENETITNSMYLINKDDGRILSTSDKSLLGAPYAYHNYDIIRSSELNEGYILTNTKYQNRILNFIQMDQNIPWILISETPHSAISSRTKPLLVTMLLLSIAAFLGSFILSLILTFRLYSPIKKLMAKTAQLSSAQSGQPVSKSINAKSEISYVTSYIDRIQTSAKDLSRQLFNHRPLLIDRFFRDLVVNRYYDSEGIDTKLSNLDIDFIYTNYAVIIVELNDYQSLSTSSELGIDTLMFAAKNIIDELTNINDTGICTESAEGQIIILLNFDEYPVTLQYLRELSQKIQSTQKELLNIDVTLSIGETVTELSDVHLSYAGAKDLLKYKMIFENTILFFTDYNTEDHADYYYPIQLFMALSESLKKSDKDSIHSYIHKIFSDLKLKKHLSYNNTYKVLTQMVDLLLQCVNDTGLKVNAIWDDKTNLYNQLNQHTSLQAIETWFLNIYSDVSDSVASGDSHDNHHVINIKTYIEEHYTEDIYLGLIAEAVGLNSSYMSRIFKQATGMTVFEYITSTRIDASKKLLAENSRPIKEIALSVGYNSTQSYIKYFKSVVGVTPGKYRKNL